MEIHRVDPEEIGNKHVCPNCEQLFTLKSSLTRHIKQNICTKPKLTIKGLADTVRANNDAMAKLMASNDILAMNQMQLMKMMGEIGTASSQKHNTHNPNVYNHNQNLNVLCLGSKDNLLDILSASEGLPLALEYLKNCALSRLSGDCRILERVYQLETEQAAIMYVNKSKTKYVYYDERRRRTVETNAKVMAKKLADILQRSYLKGMECFKTDLSGQNKDNQVSMSTALVPIGTKSNLKQKKKKNSTPLPNIEPYDLHLWNEHVHELNDEKYQKKLLNSMKIPIEPDRE
jgi:hypothetical protein